MKSVNKTLTSPLAAIALILGQGIASAQNTNTSKPNLLIIYADDMGFGDVQAFSQLYGTANNVPTPRMDALADEGMMLEQMHSCSGLCTPSRYGLLTGRYSWRLAPEGVLTGGVVGAYGQPIIRQGELTLPQFLKNQGYDTAAFGKWHLGAQWYNQSGVAYTGNSQNITNPADIDLVRRVEGHAIDQGFNHFFGLAATINYPPYATMVDDHIYYNGAPATASTPWTTISGSSLAGGSAGPNGVGDPNFTSTTWPDGQMQCGPAMISEAADYLAARASDSQPFFAFVSMYAPHLPFMVLPEFVGSCGVSNFAYGDYIYQMDHWIGQLLDALGASASNTLVVITSDNGPENFSVGQSLPKNHDPNGPFRGIKRDSWEGGHRVPCIVRWPGTVAPGTVSSAAAWQGDLYATMADRMGVSIPAGGAPDSHSLLPALQAGSAATGARTPLVIASGSVQHSLHTEDGWKLIDGPGSGGFDTTYDADNNVINNAFGTVGGSPKQLFRLSEDPGERSNLQANIPYKVTELMTLLNYYRATPSSVMELPDADSDQLPDYWEQLYGLNQADPGNATTIPPGDTFTYLQKYQRGLNPLTPDTDSDGLKDEQELYIYGTNPFLRDTDGDGVRDGDEIAAFTNPLNPASFQVSTNTTTTELLPELVQLAGFNGTVADPALSGSWAESGSLYLRERGSNDNTQWRTRLFVKFDLSGITNVLQSARLRVFQTDRLNNFTGATYSDELNLAAVTQSWSTSSGSLPLFSGTSVGGAIQFGRNDDFGTAKTASGFYSGTPGVPGTDDLGFDPGGQITTIVDNWLSGAAPNYGLRLWLDQSFTGVAFASTDIGTTAMNERFALLVTTQDPVPGLDTDHDGMLDSQEQTLFSGLGRDGTGDFDNDGIADVQELAMGSDPKQGSSRPEFALQRGVDDQLQLVFQRSLLSGMGYQINTSTDLAGWSPDQGLFTLVSKQDLGNGYERVVFSFPSPSDAMFVRLNLIFP